MNVTKGKSGISWKLLARGFNLVCGIKALTEEVMFKLTLER